MRQSWITRRTASSKRIHASEGLNTGTECGIPVDNWVLGGATAPQELPNLLAQVTCVACVRSILDYETNWGHIPTVKSRGVQPAWIYDR